MVFFGSKCTFLDYTLLLMHVIRNNNNNLDLYSMSL